MIDADLYVKLLFTMVAMPIGCVIGAVAGRALFEMDLPSWAVVTLGVVSCAVVAIASAYMIR
jgi:hypothetical protein